jgi:hypothetical protein
VVAGVGLLLAGVVAGVWWLAGKAVGGDATGAGQTGGASSGGLTAGSTGAGDDPISQCVAGGACDPEAMLAAGGPDGIRRAFGWTQDEYDEWSDVFLSGQVTQEADAEGGSDTVGLELKLDMPLAKWFDGDPYGGSELPLRVMCDALTAFYSFDAETGPATWAERVAAARPYLADGLADVLLDRDPTGATAHLDWQWPGTIVKAEPECFVTVAGWTEVDDESGAPLRWADVQTQVLVTGLDGSAWWELFDQTRMVAAPVTTDGEWTVDGDWKVVYLPGWAPLEGFDKYAWFDTPNVPGMDLGY